MSLTVSPQRRVNATAFTLVLVAVIWLVARCEADQGKAAVPDTVTMTVTATAYNSLHGQGAGADHALAAWGDRLKPGMKSIAVSRDLIPLGLGYNAEVQIEGLPGTWVVKDKMHWRWKKKIDIYMGEDLQAARNWGRRKVKITFPEPQAQE
jgi:3D (Asp-Asp-Asp) domain-containing protein